jgi:hypothetical protein
LNSDGGRALADLLLLTHAQIIAFVSDYQLVMFFSSWARSRLPSPMIRISPSIVTPLILRL